MSNVLRVFFIGLLLTVTEASLAALVEVGSASFYRKTGAPITEYYDVVLENNGEVRVANGTLVDSSYELSSSTDIRVNGSSLLDPFSIPTGGEAVFALPAGENLIAITLQGKPGGGLKISVYEDKPDVSASQKGWALLDDGTMLHNRSGLIFHRNMSSPGLVSDTRQWCGKVVTSPSQASSCRPTIDEYIQALNAGDYGVDSENGNAGYTDWRAPTVEDLVKVAAWRASPPIEAMDGRVHGEPLIVDRGFPYFQALQPDSPFIFCFFISDELQEAAFGASACDPNVEVRSLLTRTPTFWSQYQPSDKHYYFDMYTSSYGGPVMEDYEGDIWPVRGGL